MEHDDDVSAHREGLGVAGLLVAAVSEVALVANHVDSQGGGDANRGVSAGVVDEEYAVSVALQNFSHDLDQRLGRAIGGKHDHAPRTWPAPFFFQAEDGIRDLTVTGVQTCALPI